MSLRLAAGLAWVDGVSMLVAAAIVVHAFVVGRAIPGLISLLFVVIPLVVVGQIWAIGVLNAQMPRSKDRRRSWSRIQTRGPWSARKFFFASLPKRYGNLLIGLFVLAWIAAITAFPDLLHGNPVSALPGCRWPLANHGAVSCVSRATYLRAGAAVQRFAAAILFGFLTVHFGVASGELARRNRPSSPRPDQD
jgi:hypothetical protein